MPQTFMELDRRLDSPKGVAELKTFAREADRKRKASCSHTHTCTHSHSHTPAFLCMRSGLHMHTHTRIHARTHSTCIPLHENWIAHANTHTHMHAHTITHAFLCMRSGLKAEGKLYTHAHAHPQVNLENVDISEATEACKACGLSTAQLQAIITTQL